VGAWGAGNFENDAALDWVAELEAADGPDVLDRALRRVTEAGDDYLEVDAGAAALAAAEVVAALLGAPAPDLPAAVRAWVERHAAVPPPLPEVARRALTRATGDPERSEVRGLWDDAAPEDRDAWRARVADLERRLHEG
jgi:hypothetical protein